MSPDRLYTILVEPRITEKASWLGDRTNHYVFRVANDATKPEIKEAVEKLFSVSVERVTTLNVLGKVKRTTRGTSRKRNWKKAYVRVGKGQQIDYSRLASDG